MTDRSSSETAICAEPDCDDQAGVRVYVPWGDDRDVCLAHGRALAQQSGVVAVPLDEDGADWP